jgi:hypothetical protein
MAITDDSRKRCDNLACLCETPLAEATCSPYCGSSEARDDATITCACGHAACATVIDDQLHGGAGAESAGSPS